VRAALGTVGTRVGQNLRGERGVGLGRAGGGGFLDGGSGGRMRVGGVRRLVRGGAGGAGELALAEVALEAALGGIPALLRLDPEAVARRPSPVDERHARCDLLLLRGCVGRVGAAGTRNVK
jgi:hypothetical protein